MFCGGVLSEFVQATLPVSISEARDPHELISTLSPAGLI